jgi:hypothetical protein
MGAADDHGKGRVFAVALAEFRRSAEIAGPVFALGPNGRQIRANNLPKQAENIDFVKGFLKTFRYICPDTEGTYPDFACSGGSAIGFAEGWHDACVESGYQNRFEPGTT